MSRCVHTVSLVLFPCFCAVSLCLVFVPSVCVLFWGLVLYLVSCLVSVYSVGPRKVPVFGPKSAKQVPRIQVTWVLVSMACMIDLFVLFYGHKRLVGCSLMHELGIY